ncbi:MAG TPA: glycosyltransferase family 4 protein, partial [Blastocatellia bacterium]|nr:glycosyltransferase family 4 protein [Blastocatellia bacterium]
MRFLVVYNGPLNPDGGSSGTVWQSTESLRRLGHQVDVITEADIPRSVAHPNLHYAFELPRRILDVTKLKLQKTPYDAIMISQPYGYLVGKWLRGVENAPLYLHRSHGHELAVSSRFDAARGTAPGEFRPLWKQVATRALSSRLNHQARLALEYADGTIVPSQFDMDYLIEQERVPPHKVRCIHHAAIPSY